MLARTISRTILVCTLALGIALGCGDDLRKKKLGDFCSDDTDCESGICADSVCLDPDADLDGDGLKNGVEKNLTRTDLARTDTDGDGRPDGLEVGNPAAPTDTDGDGTIDALESRLPSADPDRDCIPDELDAQNATPTVDNAVLVELGCTPAGVCGEGKAQVVAGCVDGEIQCDYQAVTGWQAVEDACDGRDNDCNGTADDGALADPAPGSCLAAGVCGGEVAASRACLEGAWACVYTAIPGWEAVEALCDRRDNDCDGETDEGLEGGECEIANDEGTCLGAWKCAETGGGRVCDGPVPEAETCNGADDDCDGATDEELAGVACELSNAFGKCPGVTACDGNGGTVCMGTPAAAEACNNSDDDCDGTTDEDGICTRTASVRGVVRALSAPVAAGTLLPIAASDLPPPLAGALVKVGTGAACDGEVPAGPLWQVATGADGSFRVDVEPGDICAFIGADGFQPVRADPFRLAAGEVFPLDAVMSPQDLELWQGSLCGRLLAWGEGESKVPVSGGLVTVLDVQGASLGATSADGQGLWCVTGIPLGTASTLPVTLSVLKDGYYPGGAELTLAANVVAMAEVLLDPLPAEATTCLEDGFDAIQVPVSTMAGGPWTADEPVGGVGWTPLGAQALPNPWFDGCITVPDEEWCETGSSCPLCGEGQMEACLPGPGTVPYPFLGAGAWWFGNPGSGSYLPDQQSCGQAGKPVGGSLTSPWIAVPWVLDLRLDFETAWEVESRDPKTDLLLVEVQTPAMDLAGTWSLAADLKGDPGSTGDDPAVGLSSGGLGRAPAWKHHSLDLSAWSGTSVRIRFRFDSVDGIDNAFRGWLVDQVTVTGRGCGGMAVAR